MSALGRQVGPLPLGAWIIVVGAGLGISYYTSGGHPFSAITGSSAQASQPSTLDTSGTGANGEWVDVNPPTTAPGVVPSNNRQWGTEAVQYLIASGYDPALAESTITHALHSGKLSVREWAVWAVALAHMGAPPSLVHPTENVPGHHKPPKPPPKPPGHKPKGHLTWFTVPHNDFMPKQVAAKFHLPWQEIYNANRVGVRRADGSWGVIDGSNQPLFKGTRLIIP